MTQQRNDVDNGSGRKFHGDLALEYPLWKLEILIRYVFGELLFIAFSSAFKIEPEASQSVRR